MRPWYDDFDDLDLDFADSAITRHLLHEKRREERRLAERYAPFAGKKRKQQFDGDDFEEYDEYDDYDDDDYSDYDDGDSYSDRDYD